MDNNLIKKYLDAQKTKVVEVFDLENKKIKYLQKIKQYREITKISGDEEIVRAYILTRLVNELGYKPENVGYKKTKRGEKLMPNELYRIDESGKVLVDDLPRRQAGGKMETALDYMRKIEWE